MHPIYKTHFIVIEEVDILQEDNIVARPKYRYRSAITGRYAKPWVARVYPRTTVKEAVKPCKKK